MTALTAILFATAGKVDKNASARTRIDNTDTRGVPSSPKGHSPKPAGKPVVAHDPAHPPIDCPLRKQGINPHDMKPFEDIEKYIAFLERDDRIGWQKPDLVVKALELSGSETVADVGAGSGYFSFRLAGAVPLGKVVAIDIEPEMIRHIHHKAVTTGVENIEVKLAKSDDPQLSGNEDWVFICDVLHHVRERSTWLAVLHKQMKPGARIALIEFKEGDLPEGPPESVKLRKADLMALMAGAGFKFIDEKEDLLPYQYMLTFRKNAAPSTGARGIRQ